MKCYCPVCKLAREFVIADNPIGYILCPACSFRKKFKEEDIIEYENEIIA